MEANTKARERVLSRLAQADAKLVRAQRTLVRTSGHGRAALLLGMDEAALRRELRRADPGDEPAESSTTC
ncbi:hypothetical protein H9I49_08100 [Terrabacter sp. MAHUQ-38]|nr:hypothetical protein [Terrabacter sp. MAHUQ-38]